MDPKKYLKELFLKTLDAATPSQAVAEALSVKGEKIDICGQRLSFADRPVYVWAAGKASISMFNSFHDRLGPHITGSLVIAPETALPEDCPADQLIGASHPLPDHKSESAGKGLAGFIRAIPDNGLVISLISGGTSALVSYPEEGIAVDDLSRLFDVLNRSGARIREINTVRKCCSRIKGGGLLGMLSTEAMMVDLIISDVPGNDPAVVGSGPTTPDDSTCADACDILNRYNLWDDLPSSVRNHLEKTVEKETSMSSRPREPVADHYSYIISSAEQFAEKAAALARKDGLDCVAADEPFNGPVAEVASRIAKETQQQQD